MAASDFGGFFVTGSLHFRTLPQSRADGPSRPIEQERLMNAYKTTAIAMLFAIIASTAFAQGMAAPKDTMAAPKTDGMTAPKDSMAMSKPTHHKPMKHDSMKHDSMKSDSMAAPTH